MEDEGFRVQALRFVDVLPALDDDRELTRHLHEYFGEEGFPLPPLVAFGVRHVQAGIATGFVARAIRKSLGGVARRFLGGATAEEALENALALRSRDIGYSLDLVGEAVVSEAEALRSSAGATVKASRVRFASGAANVAPGQTGIVQLKLTTRGRQFVRAGTKKRLKGVMEISNLAGTTINQIPITLRLK